MRNVRFTPEVIKELRKLVRDAGNGQKLQTALQKIYTTGYDNGLSEATKQIRRVMTANANNQSASVSHDNDGVELQYDGDEFRGGKRFDTDDGHSGKRSPKSESDTTKQP